MDLSVKGATSVRLHEGFSAKWYPDPVKVGTIGIGFTWASDSFREWWGKHKPGVKFGPGATMTRAEADDALRYCFDREYGKAVNAFLGKDVPQHVFDAMASVTFNCGIGALDWKWAEAAKRGDYAGAAVLLRSTALTGRGPNGKRVVLPGLVRRRKEEALLLDKGIYTGVDASTPAKTDADPMADGILMRGERGVAVGQLIKDLHALGLYEGVMDDVFGFGTERAVLQFQRANGLDDDGWAGPKTLKAIAAALGKKTPNKPTPKPVEPTKRGWLEVIIDLILALFRKG